MKEGKRLEFKEKVTNTFLKTVSAFANYDGGTIIFGRDDAGKIIGLEKPDKFCLDIENKINDSITPQPNYSLSVSNSGKTITLEVKSGASKPYLYKAKAYKRNDTATIEVDDVELKRLILQGENLSFEELPSKNQQLSFSYLEKHLKEKAGIESFNKDVLRTLSLYLNETGYNNAGEILADTNRFPGIDIAKFGETISIFQKRVTSEHKSILESYYDAVEMYRDYYQYEIVDGIYRNNVEIVPEEAFREAIANAIIHREWDINASIRVSMFDDRIEIVSVGGLPRGISVESFLEGQVSILRNPIIANVFHRLRLIEKFGTGIRRIKESYSHSKTKPEFEITDSIIQVTLPAVSEILNVSEDEEIIYKELNKNQSKSISEIMSASNIKFGKTKVTKLLQGMDEKGMVIIEGQGKSTRYRIK